MNTTTRREFLRLLMAGVAAGSGLLSIPRAGASSAAHVVIVGGGIGGSTAAKYLRIAWPELRITLIEPQRKYLTCPRSNDVIVGLHTLDELTFTHEQLRDRYGVEVLIDRVTGVDPERRQVATASGQTPVYDRLIVSPGIDFRYETIEGYGAEIAETRMPHAWKAGAQTLLLKRQLAAMPEGGTMVIAPPPNPYRCPPGPYERASMIAEWLQTHNPTAKVLIVDPKDRFTKDGPFKAGWERLYRYGTEDSLIEWVSGSEGGRLLGVNAKAMTVETEVGEIRGDVVNVIPAQKAGRIAFDMGLTDGSGWCPVNRTSFESTQIPGIHVIGDACIADAMPKSGYSANTQAKVTAQAVVDLLQGREPSVPALSNTCYSLVGRHYGVSISDIYELREGRILKRPGSGGVSPVDDNPARPVLEAVYQKNWHRTFVKDVFS